MEQRVLILAPFGRDADVIAAVLHNDERECMTCGDAGALATQLDAGAGTALLTEEALANGHAKSLFSWLPRQPAWADFPLIRLAAASFGRRSPRGLRVLG